ncbi:hypothetical protein DRP04_15360 [Archaeoglobales archaeon]|nr:MAG: hypothetical protein DRP04_15360 [Archaeoglobales archaeon]
MFRFARDIMIFYPVSFAVEFADEMAANIVTENLREETTIERDGNRLKFDLDSREVEKHIFRKSLGILLGKELTMQKVMNQFEKYGFEKQKKNTLIFELEPPCSWVFVEVEKHGKFPIVFSGILIKGDEKDYKLYTIYEGLVAIRSEWEPRIIFSPRKTQIFGVVREIRRDCLVVLNPNIEPPQLTIYIENNIFYGIPSVIRDYLFGGR